ncbi:MAG: hypothetical protein HC814_06870, partial [Rhodobacteraceae bacterium]|nr:hypothetical protein [Paracoccaceae bacterium]
MIVLPSRNGCTLGAVFGGGLKGGDPDLDGWTNEEEFLADTNPQFSGSFLRLNNLTFMSPVQIFYESSTGRWYTLQYSDSLRTGDWADVGGQVNQPGN